MSTSKVSNDIHEINLYYTIRLSDTIQTCYNIQSEVNQQSLQRKETVNGKNR